MRQRAEQKGKLGVSDATGAPQIGHACPRGAGSFGLSRVGSMGSV